MVQLTVRLRNSINEALKEVSLREGVSLNAYINQVLAAEVERIKLTSFFKEKLQDRVSRDEYLRLLDRVPDGPVEPGDEIL